MEAEKSSVIYEKLGVIDSDITAGSKVYVNHSHCSTNETISGVYLEQLTIKNANNSNYIGPKIYI